MINPHPCILDFAMAAMCFTPSPDLSPPPTMAGGGGGGGGGRGGAAGGGKGVERESSKSTSSISKSPHCCRN